ncbi:hypothetical protein CEXT_228731 [Caerostris extrusa]|uniref:Uncharacterized protein n=1 Tax=Caerostris extrusa TaxID=172846 RepID=A0AAV4Q6Y1_CAEEX|nr:hypothetical protein CEXT_228731 [Caerostris extrusa]
MRFCVPDTLKGDKTVTGLIMEARLFTRLCRWDRARSLGVTQRQSWDPAADSELRSTWGTQSKPRQALSPVTRPVNRMQTYENTKLPHFMHG